MIIFEPRDDYPDLELKSNDKLYNYLTGEFYGTYRGYDPEYGTIGVLAKNGIWKEFLPDGFNLAYSWSNIDEILGSQYQYPSGYVHFISPHIRLTNEEKLCYSPNQE